MPSLNFYLASRISDVLFRTTVAHALKENFGEIPWSVASLEDSLAHPSHRVLVGITNKQMCGVMVLELVPPEATLLWISVASEWRRHGVGKALIDFFRQSVLCEEVSVLHAEVRSQNTVAQQFYKSLGFRMVGSRRDYYPDDDAWLLQAGMAFDGLRRNCVPELCPTDFVSGKS